MPDFTYDALMPTGQRNRGTLTAGSEREAIAVLDSRGLFPVSITPVRSVAASSYSWGRKIRGRYMATFYSQLADLLRSGVPLLRSLDILERQGSQPLLSEIVRDVRAKVAEGTSLAEAMVRHPRAFDELAVSMVRAGQEGGFLEDVLKRIADFTESQEDLKSKVVGAMAYPVFLAVIGFLVLTLLVVLVVPQFAPVFSKLEEKGELPFVTIALLATSRFLLSWQGLVILLAFVGGMTFFVTWGRSESGRLRLDGLRLRLPIIGGIYLSYALSRFTRLLGTMLKNGIPILQALRIAKDATGNKVLSHAIERSAENIKSGNSLAAPLTASKHFPRDVVEMIAVGEESNSLETVLVNIADALEKRTARQLELFVRLLEPLMLLVMAGVTLIVVAGLLLPIFKMGSTLRPGG